MISRQESTDGRARPLSVSTVVGALVELRKIHSVLHPQTIRLAFLLMFCCGLRRGEILNLRLADIDTEEMVLRINETKLYKSRLVPISSSVANELRLYLSKRGRKKMPCVKWLLMSFEFRAIQFSRPLPAFRLLNCGKELSAPLTCC